MELAILLAAFTATTLAFIIIYRKLAALMAVHQSRSIEVSDEPLRRFGQLLESEGLGGAERIYEELKGLRMEVERRLEEGG